MQENLSVEIDGFAFPAGVLPLQCLREKRGHVLGRRIDPSGSIGRCAVSILHCRR